MERWNTVASVTPMLGDFRRTAKESALDLSTWIPAEKLPEGDRFTPSIREE